jgi:hypothetical protein
MSLETYTRLLMDAIPEFPIHFLNIYRNSYTARMSALITMRIIKNTAWAAVTTSVGLPATSLLCWGGLTFSEDISHA